MWQKRITDYQSKLGDEMSVAPELRSAEKEAAEALEKVKGGVPTGVAGLQPLEELLEKVGKSLPSWQRSLRAGATTKLEESLTSLSGAIVSAWSSKPVEEVENVECATKLLAKIGTALSPVTSLQAPTWVNENSILDEVFGRIWAGAHSEPEAFLELSLLSRMWVPPNPNSLLLQVEAMRQTCMELQYEWGSKAAVNAISGACERLRGELVVGNFDAFVKSLAQKPASEPKGLGPCIAEAVDLGIQYLLANPEAAAVEGVLFQKLFASCVNVGDHCKAWSMILDGVCDVVAAEKPIFPTTSIQDAQSIVHTYSSALRGLDEKLRVARCANAAQQALLQQFVGQIQEGVCRRKGHLTENLRDLIEKLIADVEERVVSRQCMKFALK